MWSRTFALFLRALRLDARLLRSHLMRLALLAFVGLMLMQAQTLSMIWGAPGLQFFVTLTWINYAFATIAAAFLFATAVTEEKEERTLGLLRMADVGPLPLLLGKAAPRLVAALLILCVQFPFTLLAITLGGVSWDQVYATFWTLLAHVVFVGHLGLLFSVLCRRSGYAIGLTVLSVVLFIVLPLVARSLFSVPPGAVIPSPWLAALFEQGATASEWLIEASAATRLTQVLSTGFNESAFRTQVLSNLAAGAVLFALAWLLFDVFNRNADDPDEAGGLVQRLIRRRRGRSRRAWRLAIIGKDFRSTAGGISMIPVKLLLYGAVILLIFYVAEDFQWSRIEADEVGAALMYTMTFLVLPLELMVLSARVFRTEIKDHTWPLLLALPLSLPEVAYSKLAGAVIAIVPATFYFFLGMVLDLEGFAIFLGDVIDEPAAILGFALYFAHLLLFLHLTALFSILSNAWAGVLIALVTSFMGIVINYMAVFVPIAVMSFAGGPGVGPSSIEWYIVLAETVSLTIVVLAAAGVHWLIGLRLKSAAAQ